MSEMSASEKREAAAEHIAVEASKLARIANVNDFSLLAYLIDMVVLEAWREASESESDPNASKTGGNGARRRRGAPADEPKAQRRETR